MASDEGGSRPPPDSGRRLLSEHASQEAILDALLPAQDAVYVKDREGRYQMVNATGAANLGYTPDQLVGKTDLKVFAGQLGDRLRRSDQEIMAAGEPRTVEEPVIVGGRLRTYLSTKAPLRDSSGAVVGLVGVSTDVTALSEADEEVRRREAQLAEAQALARVGSWEWHVSTGEQSWSEEAFRIFGRDPSEFPPTPEAFLDCVHPDDRQRVADGVAKAIEPGSDGSYEMEHRIIRPDGEERICSCHGRVFFDLDGTPLRMVGAVQDVTEQRRAEADPAAERLRRILDSAQEAFVAMDAGGFISEWNQAAEETFGWPRAEAIGSGFADLIIPARFREEFWSGLRRFLEKGEGPVLDSNLELSALHRDGREFPVELTISALESDGGWEFHAFLRDISARKRFEAERGALIEKLDSLAHTDDLTGLWNRRAWDEELARELARAARGSGRLCVAMLDLDGFKAYNDTHGHQAGDELLRVVALSWRGQLRVTDVLARYGGEEFAVAFPSHALDAALPVVERLRTDIPAGETCSAGLVAWDGKENAQELVGRADEALYEAKRAGRNLTVTRP